jgi:hypothetical protein
MVTIIPLPVREAHPDRDAEARKRADRLNRATTEEMQAALAFLSMIDPDAFDIAFQAVPSSLDDLPDVGGPEPFCGRCRRPVAIFPGQGATWQHYQGTAGISGQPETAATAHEPEVEWYLPDEVPDDF